MRLILVPLQHSALACISVVLLLDFFFLKSPSDDSRMEAVRRTASLCAEVAQVTAVGGTTWSLQDVRLSTLLCHAPV